MENSLQVGVVFGGRGAVCERDKSSHSGLAGSQARPPVADPLQPSSACSCFLGHRASRWSERGKKASSCETALASGLWGQAS